MGNIASRTYRLKDGNEILIRSTKTEDAHEIVDIINEVHKEEIYTIGEPGEEYFTEGKMKEYIRDLSENHGSLFIVAETGNQIVGYLDFENGRVRKTKHAGRFAVYLRKQNRGNGIGKLLIDNLVEWAAKNPMIEKITLSVFSSNVNAISLYRKSGFLEEGRCPKDMKLKDGTYIDSVLMYKFVN